MLLHGASRYLAPHKRQAFDAMAQEAMQAREDEQRREAEAAFRLRRLVDDFEAQAARRKNSYFRP